MVDLEFQFMQEELNATEVRLITHEVQRAGSERLEATRRYYTSRTWDESYPGMRAVVGPEVNITDQLLDADCHEVLAMLEKVPDSR